MKRLAKPKEETAHEKKLRVADETLAHMILSGQVNVHPPKIDPPKPTNAPLRKRDALWRAHLDKLGCKRLVGIHFRRGQRLPEQKGDADWILGFEVQKSGIVWLYGNEEGTRPGYVAWVPITPEREAELLPRLEGVSEYIRHMDPLPRDIRWQVPYTEITKLILPSRVDTLEILPTGGVLVSMTSGQQMIWSADAQQTRPPIVRWTKVE